MRVLHLNAGNETGGGMYYLLRTLAALVATYPDCFVLGVLEKKELYHRAKRQGIPVVHLKGEGMLNVMGMINIVRFVKREHITHIHTHGPRANVLMNWLRRIMPVQWIITVHSDPTVDFAHMGWRRLVYTPLHLHAIKRAHKIISVCRAFYPVLHKHGITTRKLTTIVNGIDFSKKAKVNHLSSGKLRRRYGFTDDHFIMVQVARLEYVKGHEFALQALANIVKQGNSHVHLLLIGDGSLRLDLEEMCKKLDITNYVHFFGECSEIEVATFYQLADVTLLTSLSESFPYVLLESARAKRPVITTNVGDVKKLVKSPALGWLIEPSCSDSITEAIEQSIVARGAGKLPAIGMHFYNYASQNFSLNRCAQSIYRVYDEC